MNTVKLAGVAMFLAGVLALAYGSFSFTKATHGATLGPFKMSVQQKQTLNAPVWAGSGAIAFGATLRVLGGKRG